MNLNRLFPRLSITAKLAIAFVLLALVPLTLVSVMGVFFTVEQMRGREKELLQHDLETVGQQTARSLGDIVRQVDYATNLGLGAMIGNAGRVSQDELAEVVTKYLSADLSALFRLKAVDLHGRVTVVAARSEEALEDRADTFQPFYFWLASEVDQQESRLVPVELRDESGTGLLPAVAVVKPVHDASGEVRGAVVGEAAAADIFAEINRSSPDVTGITGLVDAEGRFLYHTSRKRDWATLLALRDEESLVDELPATAVAAILSGEVGTLSTDDGLVVTYRPLRVPGLSVAPFALYRTFPQATIGGAIRQFLAATGVVAVVIVVSVLGAAVMAAQQITRPLHALRKAARQVTGGEPHTPLEVETNDEIQDLAEDFERMASEVDRHRRRLESAVEERTRELHRTEAELSRIVSLSADGIVGLDADGRIRLWNRGAEQLFGFSSEEAIDRTLEDLILPKGPRGRREGAYLQDVMATSGAVVDYQTKRRAKSGELVPVGITQTRLVNEDGEPTGSSVVFRDIRIQEQIREQMRRSERLSAMSVMAAGLAHELNNPVAVLANRLELMQREARGSSANESFQKDLEVLWDQVGRVGAVTRDLLRFARDETDELAAICLNDVVLRVVRLLDRVVAAEGVSLGHDLAPNLPPVTASGTALETVLVNLVLNAQQASAPDGKIFVTTRVRDASNSVEIEVADTGPGVPEELRNRIFEPFFTTKEDEGGTGLGLAVCRALMERNGGTIHLEGATDGGAVFVMSLPTDGLNHAG